MAKSTLLVLLLAALVATAANAFVARPASSVHSPASRPSNHRLPFAHSSTGGSSASSSTSSQLNMSGKPEIEVVSQPDKDFLEKKG